MLSGISFSKIVLASLYGFNSNISSNGETCLSIEILLPITQYKFYLN